ncbi:aspartyl protease AED3 [Magnolia sinica]|uniref:aspartyl protease AED3 n=1 Tax=Magnolia sinica TaxID=86752 RepID=UPI00265961DD|nr:aspartyl protease AED3 [Magnolia sinica]
MTHRVMALSTIFLFLLISTSNAIDPCTSPPSQSDGSDLSILHIYSPCSPFSPPRPTSWFNTVLNMATKDPNRVTYLSSLVSQKTSVPIASGQQILQTANYVLRVKLGTPGQLMFMVLDTSSDTAWVPCSGCTGCSSTVFTPTTSSTYQSLDCNEQRCTQVRGQSCPATALGPCFFNQSYGGDSSISASLVQDSLRLALDIVPNYAFGCINAVAGGSIPKQGLLGLGRGSLSLISQTVPLYNGIFSYCLPSFKSYYFSGSLRLGAASQPKIIKTTPLLQNPHRPSLYYVNLTGISVGKKLVALPIDILTFNPSTGAGTIIDSGTVITRFIEPVYAAVRDEFRSRMNGTITSLGAFDTCFDTEVNPAAPLVTLHFSGMDVVLPVENTLIHSSATPLACLAMASAPNNVNSVLNVIANLQQQNHRILFDLVNSRLGIARENCN